MREYFCAYHSMLGGTRKLSDAECGRLFRALLRYSSGEDVELINLQGREEVLFDVYSQQIDRDTEAYEKKVAANQDNGKKGGRPKKNPENPENPVGFLETQKTQDKDKDKGNDLKKRFNDHWRTSLRARAAVAQQLLDDIQAGKLGETQCNNAHGYLCNLLAAGKTPEDILHGADISRNWTDFCVWIAMNGGALE